MIVLGLFMLHCAATYALCGCQGFRLSVLRRMARLPGKESWEAWGLLGGAGSAGVWVLMGVELASGAVLLGLKNWRESAFSASMVLLVVIWLLTVFVVRRAAKSLQPDDSLAAGLRRLATLEATRMAAWVARGVILVVIALI